MLDALSGMPEKVILEKSKGYLEKQFDNHIKSRKANAAHVPYSDTNPIILGPLIASCVFPLIIYHFLRHNSLEVDAY